MEFKREYLPKPETLRTLFFEAMQQGYGATKGQVLSYSVLEGWKRSPTYTKRFNDFYDFQVLDKWCEEGGITTISLVSMREFVSIDLWMMRYYGKYEKSAIPFLKLALQDAYKKGEFYGGRGMELFESEKHPNLIYDNNWRGTFEEFHGIESIVSDHGGSSPKTVKLGEHRFWGGMLV